MRPGDRERVLEDGKDGNGNYTCWRCGWTTTDPRKIDIGLKNVPRSEGGISTLITWLAKGSLVIEVQGIGVHRSQVVVAWKNVAAAD